ncbi:hypothetical protein PGT21_033266 [Puccinia graminis f. sp. tritici]|uniref:Uncharacterized protein n=1 Tax=Puccinia graminis f. sp. tritici TaxID=56615 RepID=A0A5B0PL28_PUCGR|nr:hypothetical protein PGT21_033266 [Puccinia graminis f. sp. tritici]
MGGYPLGYPDIRQDFRGKGASAPESAPAGGYPLALAGIRQRITDIRNGLSATISRENQDTIENYLKRGYPFTAHPAHPAEKPALIPNPNP